MPRVFGDHGHGRRPGMGERESRRKTHVLRANHNSLVPDAVMVQVDELLQCTGGEHAQGSITGNQTRGARTLAAAGGEYDGVRGDLSETGRARQR
jgi:hypothetical protein